MSTWFIWAAAIVLTTVSGVYLVGSALPESHVALLNTPIPNSSVDEVLTLIRQVQRYPLWQPGVTVTILGGDSSRLQYREVGPHGTISYVQSASGLVVTKEIVSSDLPFCGKWTIAVYPAQGGCQVRIREDGVIRPPLLRFAARYILGYTRSMRQFSTLLAAAAAQNQRRQGPMPSTTAGTRVNPTDFKNRS